MKNYRENFKNKKRIVVKIGSSSLQHPETGNLDYIKMDVLVRELCNLRNQGKDVVLVTSGAIALGEKNVNACEIENPVAFKQACAAIGQAQLMMVYQKMFSEYNQIAAQILITKKTVFDSISSKNTVNTFRELFKLNAIPIVNENDTVATSEIEIGDNDTLSAIVATIVDADLLILLSDVDGLYSDDPRKNENVTFIPFVKELTDEFINMGKKSTGSSAGTGGMNTKIIAAKIATSNGADMVIANSKDIRIIHRIMDGKEYGTLFKENKDDSFQLLDYLESSHK
jgi:glutamate 5-kinase